MKAYLNKEIKTLFHKFDLSKKGYLTKTEFECFCYTILKRPFIKRDKIFYEDIENWETKENDMRGLFYSMTDGKDILTKEKLKELCREVDFPETDTQILIENFPNKGVLEIEDIKKIFNE